MHARNRLIRIQRMMYDRLKDHAQDLLGSPTPQLKKYFLEYQKDFNRIPQVSEKSELLEDIEKADLVFCGDYHTLSQAQKTVIRVLREAIPRLSAAGRGVSVALEMLTSQDDAWVARYLRDEISERDFLKKIRFHRHWGFEWENYRRIFQFAKEHKLEIIGISPPRSSKKRSLKERDRFAARVLAERSATLSKQLCFVLMGDLHLAETHLPREMSRELKRLRIARKSVMIHQNHENIYWRLAKRGLEQKVDVVKMRKGVYCILNTPPWIKIRSHLRWTEMTAEQQSRSPVIGRNLESAANRSLEVISEIDFYDEVEEILSVICAFVGLNRKWNVDFRVRGPGDLSFLSRLTQARGFSKLAREVAELSVEEFESHFIHGENILFLSNLSLNHAAAEAGVFLHSCLSRFSKPFSSPNQDFYSHLWIEALGFFSSRILNHKRKCNGLIDLRQIVEKGRQWKRDENVTAASLALKHLKAERQAFRRKTAFRGFELPSQVSVQSAICYLKAAKLLGQILGYAIYTAVVDAKVHSDEVRELFYTSFHQPRTARRLYLEWARRLDLDHFRDIRKVDRL